MAKTLAGMGLVKKKDWEYKSPEQQAQEQLMNSPGYIGQVDKSQIKQNTTPSPLPAGYTQDPNSPNQMIKQLSPGTTETRATPEYANIAKAKARIAGNTPLPPQTQAEQIAMANLPPTPEQQALMSGLGTLTPEQANRQIASDGIAGELFTGGRAAAYGIGGALGGAAAATKGGALLGTAFGPLGTLIGAAGGAILGTAGSLYVSTLRKKRDNVKEAMSLFDGSRNNMKFIINQVNAGRMTNIEAAELWDEELANFYAAERNMKELTDSDLDRFLSKGLDQYEELESFKRRLPYMQGLLAQAIMQPNANMMLQEEIPANG